MAAPESTFRDALGPRAREALQGLGRVRTLRPGEVLHREGESTDHVALVEGGSMKVARTTADGRELVLGIRGVGDLLGEMAAIDGSPREWTGQDL